MSLGIKSCLLFIVMSSGYAESSIFRLICIILVSVTIDGTAASKETHAKRNRHKDMQI